MWLTESPCELESLAATEFDAPELWQPDSDEEGAEFAQTEEEGVGPGEAPAEGAWNLRADARQKHRGEDDDQDFEYGDSNYDDDLEEEDDDVEADFDGDDEELEDDDFEEFVEEDDDL